MLITHFDEIIQQLLEDDEKLTYDMALQAASELEDEHYSREDEEPDYESLYIDREERRFEANERAFWDHAMRDVD